MPPTNNLTPIQQIDQDLNALINKILAFKASLLGGILDGQITPTSEHYQAAFNLTLDTMEFACEVKQAAKGEG